MSRSAHAAVPERPAPMRSSDDLNPGWNAHLQLGFERGCPDRTVLTRREHRGPLRIQKALYPEGPSICHAVVIHPPGGIVGGDSLSLDIELAPHTHALITTPGATKWYKTTGAVATQQVRVRVATSGVLEWLPQESIIFNHARATSGMQVDLCDDSIFLGWETLCFGRTASAESFNEGVFRQRWRIRQNDSWLWNEAGEIAGGSALMTSPVGLNGQPVCATLIVAGRPVSAALLADARAILDRMPCAARMATSRLPQVFVARYSGPSAEEARLAFVALWSVLRPQLIGIEARAPRLWAT